MTRIGWSANIQEQLVNDAIECKLFYHLFMGFTYLIYVILRQTN